MPCNGSHLFHRECIFHWLNINSVCPICRLDLNTANIHTLYKAQALDDFYLEDDQEKKNSDQLCRKLL